MHGELYAELGGADAGLALMLRKGTRSGTATGRLEGWLDFRHLLGGDTRGVSLYVQAFSGFGDSLIDYDRKIQRVALGVSVR